MGDCCGGGGYKPKGAENVANDPVCGMKVNCDAKDALKLTYGDKEFYFCSTMCMTKFTNDPGAYKNNERCFFGLFPKKKSG